MNTSAAHFQAVPDSLHASNARTSLPIRTGSHRTGIAKRRLRCSAPAVATQGQVVATYTPYDANTWTMQLRKSGVKILCDPWFVESLSFADQKWFFEGTKAGLKDGRMDWMDVVLSADFILLSQSLEDHTHLPTLRQIPKDIRVIGTPEAARTAINLGFERVVALDHEQEVSVCDGAVTVRAVKGALVGPPWSKRQNAYLITETDGTTVFYEPHASFDASAVRAVAPVDVAVVPTTSTYASGFPLVEGLEGVPDLIKLLRPKVLVPLVNNSIEYEGLLAQLLSSSGSNDPSTVAAWLSQQGVAPPAIAGPQSFGQPVDVVI